MSNPATCRNLSRQIFNEIASVDDKGGIPHLITCCYFGVVMHVVREDVPQCVVAVANDCLNSRDPLFWPNEELMPMTIGLNGTITLPHIIDEYVLAHGDTLLFETVRDMNDRLEMLSISLIVPGNAEAVPPSDRTGDTFKVQGTETGRISGKKSNMKPAKPDISVARHNLREKVAGFLATARVSMGYPPRDKSPQRASVGDRFTDFVDALIPADGYEIQEILGVTAGQVYENAGDGRGLGISKLAYKALKKLSEPLAHWVLTGKKK